MGFNKRFKTCLAAWVLSCGLSGCGAGGKFSGEDLIGSPLASVSDLSRPDQTDRSRIAVYDKTTSRIHEFDLEQSRLFRSTPVRFPGRPHYVLYDDQKGYVVDLTRKGVSIVTAAGSVVHDPVRFLGEPLSAAFRPDLGLLIIYDHLQTVSFIRFSNAGAVEAAITLGPVVSGNVKIVAGDLLNDGRLLLSLSDQQIALVDVTATMAQGQWQATFQSPGLGVISWVGPSPQSSDRVLLYTTDGITLWNVSAATSVATMSFNGLLPIRLSKTTVPHVVMSSGNRQRLFYANGDQIAERSFGLRTGTLLGSYLNLDANTLTTIWSYSEARQMSEIDFNDPNFTKDRRELASFRLSDMLAQSTLEIRSDAEVTMSRTFVFSLFSSPLGYATKENLLTQARTEFTLFNLPYIQ